jgi:outer membrane protein TolC
MITVLRANPVAMAAQGLVLIFTLTFTPALRALTVDQFLAEVQKRNKNFQSLETSTEGAEDRRVAGDIGLSPVLTMAAGYLSDEKQPQQFGTKTVSRQYSLGVAKEFSTGTQAAVTGNVQQTQVSNPPPPYANYADFSAGSLGVSVSQSLWKNGFGTGTRLRQQREASSAQMEKQNYTLQQRQILIQAEAAYWDYLYQKDELMLRQESLDRARKIDSWLRRRFSDGINDKADYLNGQALAVTRELQLAVTKDQAVAAEKTLRDMLELSENEPLPPFESDFKKSRGLTSFVEGQSGRVVRLDAYIASLEAKTKQLGAEEAANTLKPDLVLQAAYNTNSNIQPTTSEAVNNISSTAIPTTSLGVKFTYMFDTDAKSAQQSLARKEALASKLKSERKLLESDTSWAELQRRYNELLKQIDTADRISQLQTARAREQTLKLNRGRAITSDVINSEEDAANSALSVNKLRAEARKLEAQSRMYVRLEEK